MIPNRTNLKKTSFAVMFFCLPFGLLFSACAYALYNHAASQTQGYWVTGLAISLFSIVVPVSNKLLCRNYDRVLVRGLGILALGMIGIYIFGLVCCFYPLYFFPLDPPASKILNIFSLFIFFIWTLIIFFDASFSFLKIKTFSEIFIEKNNAIEFDLKNILFLRKNAKSRNFQRKIYFWIIIAAAPSAPFLSRILSNGDAGSPYFYYIIFAISAPIFLWIWRALLFGVTIFFLYPLYLELKNKKPVIEVGSFNNNRNH